jgi:hypothetical protein
VEVGIDLSTKRFRPIWVATRGAHTSVVDSAGLEGARP